MTLLVPDVGDTEALKRILNDATPDNLKLKLYTNNKTPAKADTVANYTESTATGYAAKTLTGTDWTYASNAGVTTASFAAQTFTYTAAETVYGYYVTNNAGTTLMWAELFSSVFNIPSGGGSITITPKFTGN